MIMSFTRGRATGTPVQLPPPVAADVLSILQTKPGTVLVNLYISIAGSKYDNEATLKRVHDLEICIGVNITAADILDAQRFNNQMRSGCIKAGWGDASPEEAADLAMGALIVCEGATLAMGGRQ